MSSQEEDPQLSIGLPVAQSSLRKINHHILLCPKYLLNSLQGPISPEHLIKATHSLELKKSPAERFTHPQSKQGRHQPGGGELDVASLAAPPLRTGDPGGGRKQGAPPGNSTPQP
ncbi:hypothetical protein H671_5g13590 [Cricetulus griseus]|nr:hypothetical protein H671_5g13590 [Cricetulus griseus]